MKDGANNTVSYAYDLNSHPTTLTYPGAVSATYHYDNAGRMDSVQDWKSNKTTFGYDANSNLLNAMLPSATGVTDSTSRATCSAGTRCR